MEQKSELRYAKALQAFLEYIPEEGAILEMNAGQLKYSRIFFKEGYKLINVELSTGPIKYENKYALDTIHSPIDQVILPFRSINGIWAHQTFASFSRKQLISVLDHCSDWLAPSGVLTFCMPEGEGEMLVQTHTHHGPEKKRKVFYQAQELAQLLDSLQFEVLKAWRESHQDHYYLHVICRNG